MRVSILTLNPGFFDGPLGEGMIRIAREKGIVDVARIQIRDFATDRYGTTDDTPYGGGAGMVMKVDTIVRAFESARASVPGTKPRTLVTSPQGRVLTQDWARELAGEDHLVLVCGRYKGIDERVIPLVGAEEVSIGDYVLSGGKRPRSWSWTRFRGSSPACSVMRSRRRPTPFRKRSWTLPCTLGPKNSRGFGSPTSYSAEITSRSDCGAGARRFAEPCAAGPTWSGIARGAPRTGDS